MLLDLERVHDVLEGRNCYGKTTAMIVTALGYADFDGPEVLVVGCDSTTSLF